MLSKRADKLALGILIVLHLVGLFGILSEWSELFLSLSPVHLIVAAIILFWFHPSWDARQAGALFLIFTLSFGLEVLGVKSRVIFGSYDYLDMLGAKALGVPFVIGLLWVLLVYSTHHILKKYRHRFKPVVLWFFGALMMVGLDALIEPLSESLGYWRWEEGSAPPQNFLVWFIAAFVFQAMLAPSQKELATNKMAFPLFLLFLLFFFGLNLFL
jgi:uncharacterized membrane protein